MTEERRPVHLQAANRHNLPLRFAHVKVAEHSDFSNPAAVIVCLRLHPEVMTNERAFQIVDSRGEVVMDDCKIQLEVGNH